MDGSRAYAVSNVLGMEELGDAARPRLKKKHCYVENQLFRTY